MPVAPATVYQQSVDKQRIVITGEGSDVIGAIIRHVLLQNNRKFDFISPRNNGQALSDAPLVIIEAPVGPELLDYRHHVGVVSHVDHASAEQQYWMERFANATPKSGILVYADADSKVKAIATRERPDVLAIPFKTYAHEDRDDKTILITSTNERVPIALSGDTNLQCVSAAKEVLKKIGITSGQFYRALATFQLN